MVERYSLRPGAKPGEIGMDPNKHGFWVQYDDYLKAVVALESENKHLRQSIKDERDAKMELIRQLAECEGYPGAAHDMMELRRERDELRVHVQVLRNALEITKASLYCMNVSSIRLSVEEIIDNALSYTRPREEVTV